MELAEQIAFLRTISLFSALDDKALACLSAKLETLHLSSDEVLVEAGDVVATLYLIKRGQLDVFTYSDDGRDKETLAATKYVGDCAGEIALLTGVKRNALVRAEGDTELLCLSKESFESFSLECPEAFHQLTQTIIQKFQRVLLRKMLYSSDTFKSLEHEVLKDLGKELDVAMVKGGTYLYREGDDSKGIHFIVSGRLQLRTDFQDGTQKVWAKLGRGQSVGEMALLTGNKHSVSVVAMRDTLIATLSQDAYYRLLVKYPHSITKRFSGAIVDDLWTQIQGGDRTLNTLFTFTVTPANSDVPLDDFCDELTKKLSLFGKAVHLNSARVDSILARKGAAQTLHDDAYNLNLTQWLSEQEAKHQFIVFQTDADATSWSKRCLMHADKVLLVAQAQSSPKLGEIGGSLGYLCNRVDKTLVLLHKPQVAAPLDSIKWIQKTRLDSHIHVRQKNEKDFIRLARLLTGNSASLVLSGGGAHGFAHIGAIRAMEEAGLQIDQIGGTSMGALLAAEHAMGWDSNTMMEKSREAIVKHYKMDYTLPVVSLLTGKSWGDFLETLFGATQIEDLWLNYFCCASSLTDAKLKVYDSGLLSKYVRASSAIPGIVPPIYDNGGLIVDGAVLNNMPINIMQERSGGGSIYAVDVGDGLDSSQQKPFDPVQSGWRLAFSSKKNKSEIPNIMSILIQSATMGSQMTQEKARNMADLYITPQVQSYSMLDVKDIDSIVEAGYTATKMEIERWLNEAVQRTN